MGDNMKGNGQSGLWYAAAVVVTLGSFSGCNALWNYTAADNYFPYDIAVDLLAGSVVALFFMGLAIWTGRLQRHDLGLGQGSWSAPKRLLALAMVLICIAPNLMAQSRQHPEAPLWRDYSILFVLLLGSNLAELLVFIGVTFCLTEHCLKQRGLPRPVATGAAACLSAVSFGLFHYTYLPAWHPYVFLLMGVMGINLVLYILTRNLYLTLLLHSAFAATGFLEQHYAGTLEGGPDATTTGLALELIAFGVPFLALHWLEWPGWRGQQGTVEKPLTPRSERS